MSNLVEVKQDNQNNALGVIQQMVKSGNFDVSVARELLEMQKDFMKQQAIINYNNDFSLMSKEIPIIAKRAEAHKTKYAPLEDIVKVVQPILSKHGFSISFTTEQQNLDAVTVNCFLQHKDGHSSSTSLMLPTKPVNAGMNPMQAIGSAITYAKRYTICGILNIATGDDDNNGFAVNAKTEFGKKPISDKQLEQAITQINEKKRDLNKFIEDYNLTPTQLIKVGQEVSA